MFSVGVCFGKILHVELLTYYGSVLYCKQTPVRSMEDELLMKTSFKVLSVLEATKA